MSVLGDWIGPVALFYFAWPIVVMLAYVVWKSLKADTIRGLFVGVAAILMFAAIALLGWIVGSALVGMVLVGVMGLLGVPQVWIQLVALVVMAAAMSFGAVYGWRLLESEMGGDARLWKL